MNISWITIKSDDEIEDEKNREYFTRILSYGDIREILRLGCPYLEKSSPNRVDIQTVYPILVAAHLIGRKSYVRKLLNKLHEHKNYSAQEEGNISRRLAVYAINSGQLDSAKEFLNRAEDLFKDDQVRQATVTAVRGRLYAKQGLSKEAQAKYNEAIAVWEKSQYSNDSVPADWQLECHHWNLELLSKSGESSVKSLRFIIENEPSLKKRLKARRMHAFRGRRS